MFKRSPEESEWSRFSKAFTKEKEERAETDGESAPSSETSERTAAEAAVAAPAISSLAARSSVGDTNLTLARPSANAAAYPTYSVDDAESTIGEHTFVDGTYRSESSMRIRGSVKGEIECSKAVFIEENAKVSAKVKAASITVAGEVDGELHCSGRVELRPTGRVTGSIFAGTLVMQEGAFFDGNLKMQTSGEAGAAS